MDTPSSQLVDLPWGRMCAKRSGSGPPLVLVHGYLVSSRYFAAVLPELEKHFAVFAFDLPGHGDTDSPSPEGYEYTLANMADSVAQAMDRLGLGRARVWGHSMGGGVSLHLAARHPDKVERLVLEDALGLRMAMPVLAHIGNLPVLGRYIYRYLYSKRDLSNHLHGVHNDPKVCTDEDVDVFWACFNRPGARDALQAQLHMICSLPVDSDAPARVQAPTLVFFGADDRTVPVDNGRRIAQGIAGSRFEVVPACGHSPHEERPAEALALALPFLLGEATGGVAGEGGKQVAAG